MTPNDFFLILTWVVGIGAAVVSVVTARRRVRAEAQNVLDMASFKGAQEVIDLLREQLRELREELSTMRGEFSALRAREGKLLRRIQVLESVLRVTGLTIPEEEGT